ncbi:MAG: hypothetical protein K0R52_489 [Alphaproteobacteria bacterium]|jgi:uncharacterized SAM-binding protein YcdF (DUF218 family)|nr:hypothetical protein [Alphaproteobacteria bacterium]
MGLGQFVSRILKVTLLLFLLWVGGLALFFSSIPQHVTDEQTTTEAIIVLTGGRERLKTGFQLLCARHAKMIFISGVHPEETLKSLLKSLENSGVSCALSREQLTSSSYLGYTAKNTRGNAQEIAAWIKEKSITSFRLVTAAYHMPRSLMELKHILPHTTIIPHPVFPYGDGQSQWWWNEGALYMVFSEYNKFLWGFLRVCLSA